MASFFATYTFKLAKVDEADEIPLKEL